MKIYLTYCSNQSVDYCFWKYFFLVTGIWTEDRYLSLEDEVDYSKTPQLVLIDHEFKSKISEKEYEGIIYCLRGSNKIKRKDIVKSFWYDVSYQRQVLELLFQNGNQKEDLQAWNILLDIFRGDECDAVLGKKLANGLWAASWLLNEINYSEQVSWSEEIAEICEKVMDRLGAVENVVKELWNYQYMQLYCEYLQCVLKKKSEIQCDKDSRNLLKKCCSLAEESGWKPTLSLLAGKISLLIFPERKNAVSYYKDVLAYSGRSDIYYEVGRIYEKVYKDNENALRYYQKAYERDRNNYRAIYKFALSLENRGRWRDAISVYLKIRRIIKQHPVKNYISITDIEYNYKACKRIIYICEERFYDDELLMVYRTILRRFQDNLKWSVNFKRLAGVMFDDKNARKKAKEIKEEINLKIKRDYCK